MKTHRTIETPQCDPYKLAKIHEIKRKNSEAGTLNSSISPKPGATCVRACAVGEGEFAGVFDWFGVGDAVLGTGSGLKRSDDPLNPLNPKP